MRDAHELIELARNSGDDLTFVTGIDDAFVGIGMQCGRRIAVYDTCLAIDTFERDLYDECELEDHEECDHEQDAIDWFEYNVLGTYTGETTPIFVETCLDSYQ